MVAAVSGAVSGLTDQTRLQSADPEIAGRSKNSRNDYIVRTFVLVSPSFCVGVTLAVGPAGLFW